MLYLPKHTYHRWHQHDFNRHGAKKGGIGTPGVGMTILTKMKTICVPPYVPWEGFGPLLDGGGWLPEMDGWGVLKDLFPDMGQLVLA